MTVAIHLDFVNPVIVKELEFVGIFQLTAGAALADAHEILRGEAENCLFLRHVDVLHDFARIRQHVVDVGSDRRQIGRCRQNLFEIIHRVDYDQNRRNRALSVVRPLRERCGNAADRFDRQVGNRNRRLVWVDPWSGQRMR